MLLLFYCLTAPSLNIMAHVHLKTRINLYQDAERILVEDVGGIFLTHMVTHQVWYPYLTGFEPDKNGNVVFRYLDIARFQMYMRNDVERWRG